MTWRTGIASLNSLLVPHSLVLQVRTRFVVAMPQFKVQIVDKDGVREVPFTA